MSFCPCCSDLLLRHVRVGQTYLYCHRCRFESLEVSPSLEVGSSQLQSPVPTQPVFKNNRANSASAVV
ncbi:MAG TPA: hypothetical protein V6D03_15540 [Candidatus Caenarcaniphilales bacterium]